MKRIFYGVLLAAAIACFSGCNIAGGDMPEYYSEQFLRERNEPETLIQAVLKLKALPPEEFQRLANYSNRFVDRMLGRNQACPETLLKQFSGSFFYYVRRGVAENPNAPYGLLKKLSLDSNDYVRMSVAANPSIPVEMMEQMANRKDEYAHNGLAMNPAAPPDLLRKLYHQNCADPYSYRFHALYFAGNPKLPEDIARDIFLRADKLNDPLELRLLFDNPSCPEDIKQKIRRQ